MIREEMLKKYDASSAAELHLFGFEYRSNLYTYTTNDLHDVDDALKLGRAAKSHGGALKIRVYFPKLLKEKLVATGKAVKIGTMSAMDYADQYNQGEHFEHLIHELNGQTWVKDNVPFYEAGDIEINGKQIQIKLDGATLVTETTLVRLYA